MVGWWGSLIIIFQGAQYPTWVKVHGYYPALTKFYHLFLVVSPSFTDKILNSKDISLIRVLISLIMILFYSFNTIFVSTSLFDESEVCDEDMLRYFDKK